MIVSTGPVAGLCGPLLMWLMTASHNSFLRLKLSPPRQLALGGLIVGLLSLLTPTVWETAIASYNHFCSPTAILADWRNFCVQNRRCSPAAGLARRAASLRQHYLSDYPLECFWVGYGDSGCRSDEIAILLGLAGMATLLAATTHAPIMSTLMICEMTGEYQLLPVC